MRASSGPPNNNLRVFVVQQQQLQQLLVSSMPGYSADHFAFSADLFSLWSPPLQRMLVAGPGDEDRVIV